MSYHRKNPGAEDVEWGGRIYRRQPDHPNWHRRSYFMATTAPRTYLHRDIYVKAHGPIPAGHHVHHKDHDPLNNDPSNLATKHARVHAAEHFAEREKREHICERCGKTFTSRKWTSNIRWCGPACKEAQRRDWGVAYVKPRIGPYIAEHKCEECGESYTARQRRSRFCSHICRCRAGNRRRRDEKLGTAS